MIRLLLVEDQEIIRRGLKTLLDTSPNLEVVADAENGEHAIQVLEALHATAHPPDIILMDIRMPIMDGVTATQYICQQFPGTKILILTTFDDTDYVAEALRHGAKGYLLKDTSPEELEEAIHSIHQGYTQFGAGILEKAMEVPTLEEETLELGEFTIQEREVLRMVVAGYSNREIAHELVLSEATVKNYISRILSRLTFRTR
jgi:DNA-binding NarL/FixJ family response regulator